MLENGICSVFIGQVFKNWHHCVLRMCGPRIKMGSLIPVVLITYHTQVWTSCNGTAWINTDFHTIQILSVSLRVYISKLHCWTGVWGQFLLYACHEGSVPEIQFCFVMCSLIVCEQQLYCTDENSTILLHVMAKMWTYLFAMQVAQMFSCRCLHSSTSLIQFFAHVVCVAFHVILPSKIGPKLKTFSHTCYFFLHGTSTSRILFSEFGITLVATVFIMCVIHQSAQQLHMSHVDLTQSLTNSAGMGQNVG
jgi:hypothetical protein